MRDDRAGASDFAAGLFLPPFGPRLSAGISRHLAARPAAAALVRKTWRWTISSPPPRSMARRCCARISRAPCSTPIASPTNSTPNCSTRRRPPTPITRSLRVAGGLGAVARVVSEGKAIYADRIPLAEGLERIESLYKPYHAMLEALMARAHAEIRRRRADRLPFHALAHADRRHPPPLRTRQRRHRASATVYGASCDAGFAHRVHRPFSPASAIASPATSPMPAASSPRITPPAHTQSPRAADRDQPRALSRREDAGARAGLRAAQEGHDPADCAKSRRRATCLGRNWRQAAE